MVLAPAKESLEKLPRQAARRVRAALERLAEVPRPSSAKALATNPGYLRIRVGSYRVVYTVRAAQLLVLVVRVEHRKHAYDRLPSTPAGDATGLEDTADT
jgi:mRNA interferase RelE/StbE